MESVGQQLRIARSRVGLALEDVSARTRISLKNLHAIENDDLSRFSSAFFYKSFVRQFANCVSLDFSQLSIALNAALASLPEPLVPGQPGAPVRPDLPGLRPQRTRKLRWLASVASLIVMLFVCSQTYDVWQRSRTAPEQRPVHVRVQLSALERTWLSVAADGHQVFSGTLQPEETKTLEGHETARLHTGNAGGIEVVFNGRTLGRLGREGEARTVVFTRNGYNFAEPREHVAAAFIFTPNAE
jgi:RodZ C-terminal domain/Helix-turn-helix domain